MIATEKDIKNALKKPDYWAYFGDLPIGETWGVVGPGQHRDSDPLDRSNFQVITNDILARFPDEAEIIRSSHFLVGWSEELACRVIDEDGNSTEVFDAVLEWSKALADYPVADETHYCELEHQEFYETVEQCYYPSSFKMDDKYYEEVEDLPDDWADQLVSHLYDHYAVSHPDDLGFLMVQESQIELGFVKLVE